MHKRTLFCLWMLLLLLPTMLHAEDFPADDNWRSLPLQCEIRHPQPMTGVVLWPNKARKVHQNYGQCIQLEFNYFEYCEIVKGCREDSSLIYDWTPFDDALRDVASRGHQLLPRFFFIYPGDPNDEPAGTTVPQYIKDLEDYQETSSQSAGTYYPDWSHPELERFTLQFYTDFAERYAQDPRLAFLEIGFGHWAEYHIYPTPVKYGKNFPSKAFQKQFLLHIDDVCKGLPWLLSKNAGDNSPIPSDQDLLALPFGLFEDSFMGDYFLEGGYKNRWESLSKGVRWQYGVCGGEIGPSHDERLNFLNPEGLFGHIFEDVAAEYHISFAISNAIPDSPHGTPERVKQASMSLGYRFVVTQCLSDGLKTKLLVTNQGIAPIYRDAYFAIGDVRSETSLLGLLPGQERWMEIAAAPAADGSDICIVCDHILPQQQIEFEAHLATPNASTPLYINSSPSKVFSISGQPLPAPQPGLNLIDGQKVWLK